MIELLAIPGWQTGPTKLDAWVAALEETCGAPVTVVRESPQGSWVAAGSIRIRGFAILAGPHVEAINFELSDPDPAPATSLLEAASAAIGWEIHPDDEDEEDDED